MANRMNGKVIFAEEILALTDVEVILYDKGKMKSVLDGPTTQH